ncbi:10791_t:CDS:2, partial [Racocetra fulgida]
LEDVRKKLAEGRDDWEAEKLLFKQNDIQIYHKDEIHYKLEKIQVPESDKYIIYVENLLKKVKAHIDDRIFTFSLDPGDKLEKIRIILLGKFVKIFNNEVIDFKFRWKDGRIVDKFEETLNNLEEILVNGNELYVSTLQESEITIYSSHTGAVKSFIFTLHKGKKLTEIRKELEDTWKEHRHHYMCPDCCFLNREKARIPKSKEDKLTLGEILLIQNGQNVLNIHREHDSNDYDLVKLINKCGYGFITKNVSVEQAEYRAFTITETPDQHVFENKYEEDTLKCKTEFHELCERNFITFGNTTSILPWVSVFFGVNREVSLKKLENYQKAIEYSYARVRRVCINISKNNTKEFNDDVEKALEEKAQDKKVENLKQIAEKYGYFYASSVYFDMTVEIGLQMVKADASSTSKTGQNSKTETSNTECYRMIKGGDISKSDRCDWINSLNDPEKWDIIEYHHINSIFSLLKNDLQIRVLEALGKRILRVDEIIYPTEEERYIHKLAGELNDIPNINECQIFTTIIKERKDRHIFS